MAAQTKIEWTDSTFNPWIGCTKIAPACDHCYAAAIDKRTGGDHWGNVPRRRTSEANWKQPRQWQRKASEFFAEHGRRRRVFCASMADVFDNQVPVAWRDDLWLLIRATPDLDWLLLTKRPQNIDKMLPAFWDEVKGHVWLGTTVEDQRHAAINIPYLCQHDAAVRFISYEPALGPIEIPNYLRHLPNYDSHHIDWVIAGGESGPHARPSDPAWFRSLRDQCTSAGVPFLFKQWGEWGDADALAGEELEHFDVLGRTAPGVVRVGKNAAGRHLDGQLHDGFPRVA